MGNDLSPLLTALIRSKTGLSKFTCIMSCNSHNNPTGKELSSEIQRNPGSEVQRYAPFPQQESRTGIQTHIFWPLNPLMPPCHVCLPPCNCPSLP